MFGQLDRKMPAKQHDEGAEETKESGPATTSTGPTAAGVGAPASATSNGAATRASQGRAKGACVERCVRVACECEDRCVFSRVASAKKPANMKTPLLAASTNVTHESTPRHRLHSGAGTGAKSGKKKKSGAKMHPHRRHHGKHDDGADEEKVCGMERTRCRVHSPKFRFACVVVVCVASQETPKEGAKTTLSSIKAMFGLEPQVGVVALCAVLNALCWFLTRWGESRSILQMVLG